MDEACRVRQLISPHQNLVTKYDRPRNGGKLYICPVYTWWISFETAPVTESLVSVAAHLRVAEFVTLFLDIADSFAGAIRGTNCSRTRCPGGRIGYIMTDVAGDGLLRHV